MKPLRIFIAAAFLVGVAGCQATSPKMKADSAAPASMKHETKAAASAEKKSMEAAGMEITTEEQFRETIVDRRFVGLGNAASYFISHADGRLTGEANGKTVSGTWHWEGVFYCRTLKLGGKDLGSDCQKVVFDGEVASFTRKMGEGKTAKLRLAK